MSDQDPERRSSAVDPDTSGHGRGEDGSGIEQLRGKSFSFALSIVELCSVLESCGEFVVSRQLLESGTAIGTAIEEAAAGGDREEVLLAMRGGIKAARKTLFWLRLLHRSSLVAGLDVMNHIRQADELARMLTSTTQSAMPPK
jgi:four helix bundle protein